MGVIKQGILGGFSGKVGSVVGSSWKGLAVIKAKPLSVANPKTAGQVAQRGAFASVVAFAGNILASTIKPLNDKFATKQSGYNKFIKLSIDAFDTNGLSDGSLVKISQGSLLAVPSITGASSDGNVAITLGWTDNSGEGNALATDKAYAVVYNETQDSFSTASGTTTREDEGISVSLDAVAESDVLHCYVAFLSDDGSKVSNTVYKEVTVAA